MIKLKQLDKLQEDYLTKLTVPELRSYILDLATEYYISIASKDHKKISSILEIFQLLEDLHKEKNIESYINYALIMVFNKVILNSASTLNLKEPTETSNSYNGNILYVKPTELEKIIEYFQYKKIFEKKQELAEANLSEEEILELFHYKDYFIGVNNNG